jgi:hypothetical protein
MNWFLSRSKSGKSRILLLNRFFFGIFFQSISGKMNVFSLFSIYTMLFDLPCIFEVLYLRLWDFETFETDFETLRLWDNETMIRLWDFYDKESVGFVFDFLYFQPQKRLKITEKRTFLRFIR